MASTQNQPNLPPGQVWSGVPPQSPMQKHQGYVQIQSGQQQLVQYDENWTQNQQQVYQGNYIMTQESPVSGDSTINGSQSTVSSDTDTAIDELLADVADVIFYGQNQIQGTLADHLQGNAYDFSDNFSDISGSGLQTPAPFVALTPVTVSLATTPVIPIQKAPAQNPKARQDPEYLEKRRKNNLAAKESRKKKKKTFQELEAKCARQKEKIQVLKQAVAQEQAGKEQALRRYVILNEMFKALQKKKQTEDDDDIQVIDQGQVAIPSGQGFGLEKSRDF